MSTEKFGEAKKFQARMRELFVHLLGKERGGPALISKETGISAGTISDWMNEEAPTAPDQISLKRISEKFKVRFEWLATGEGGMLPEAWRSFPDGLPRDVRDAIQKAVLMVEDFLSVIPPEKLINDRAQKALFITTAANLLVVGRQEEIPELMGRLLKRFFHPPKSPPEDPSGHPGHPELE